MSPTQQTLLNNLKLSAKQGWTTIFENTKQELLADLSNLSQEEQEEILSIISQLEVKAPQKQTVEVLAPEGCAPDENRVCEFCSA